MNKVKFYLLACVFIALAFNGNAQKYYYFKGEKVNLTIDSTQLIVITNNNFQALPNIADLSLTGNDNSGYLKKTAFSSKPTTSAYLSAIKSLQSANGVKRVLPAFKRGEHPIGVSDLFYVKLKNQNDLGLLQNVAQQKGVAIVQQIPNMPLWYILQMQDGNSSDYFDIVNSIYETGLFAASAPDFLFNFQPMSCGNYNDPQFGSQWYLQDGEYGINACAAWDISTGAGVKVAVVDKGIDFSNPDLINRKEGDGFNTEADPPAPPSVVCDPNDWEYLHGTNVAELIVAERNNNYWGIGVAPDAKIMGVSSHLAGTYASTAKLASGIKWAAQNGADVINNSWGDTETDISFYNSQNPYYGCELLEEAIDYALTQGRDGKGCVVVFPTADFTYHPGSVYYPANCNDGILVVGLMDNMGRCDDIPVGFTPPSPSPNQISSSYSNGYRVDVVAPQKVYNVSYSAALVSGVAALVLQVNPNLTGADVKRIIKNTADNTKGKECNGYDTFYGTLWAVYQKFFGSGLVNAYKAVQAATKPDLLVRDDKNDNGTEPNPRTITWNSPDIKFLDFEYPHKQLSNGELHNRDKCIIAVTVKNISGIATTGEEKLHVYWNKLTLNSLWDYHWTNLPYGEEITDPVNGMPIDAVLQYKESKEVWVEWNIPDFLKDQNTSNNYFNQLFVALKYRFNWGVAILARIDDGNPIQEVGDEYGYVMPLRTTKFAQKNNNVAVSNGNAILFAQDYTMLANVVCSIGIGSSVSYNQLIKDDKYKLNDFAEVYALLSNDLMEYVDWAKCKGIKRVDENSVFLESANSEIVFKPLKNENGEYFIGTVVNFISDKMPELNDFDFDLIYKKNDEETETMRITAVRDPEVYFKAHAEASKTKVVKSKEEVTLTSNIIYNNATYTWYDEAGRIIGNDYQITIIPEYSQKYKIEILQEKDGFKSYDEVEVIVVDGMIKSLAPNPAADYIHVDYMLSDNATNASIQISNIQNTISVSYPISTTETYKDIYFSNFVSGYYFVKLIISGTVVDAQTLIIK